MMKARIPMTKVITDNQRKQFEELLWEHLKHDPSHADRRQTGWGTKTKDGLIACIERIIEEE